LSLDRLYRFVQFEYAWPLGPADGRYLLREHAGEDAHHVLVVASWATTTTRRARRWGKEPEPLQVPAETGLGRATLVDSATVDDETAGLWLDAAAGPRAAETVDEALRWLNFVLRAHRAAAADAYVREVRRSTANAVRVGYGSGDLVADGKFAAAYELPEEARKRGRAADTMGALERLAAVLSGTEEIGVAEELVLRARLDLDSGRPREAALQARVALEALLASGYGAAGELSEHRRPVGDAANAALHGKLSPELSEAVATAVEDMRKVLRRTG